MEALQGCKCCINMQQLGGGGGGGGGGRHVPPERFWNVEGIIKLFCDTSWPKQ